MIVNRKGRATVSISEDAAVRVGWRRIFAVGIFALASLATLVTASDSRAVDEVGDVQEVSWFHPSPGDVRGFVLFVSAEEGDLQHARQIDVGKPSGSKTQGGQFFSAMVSMAVDEYVAVSAIGANGLESDLSAWGRPQPTQPGQPLVVDP